MKNRHILFLLFVGILLSNCKKNEPSKTAVYNQKANQLILQTLKENKCNCILQVPKESMVEISEVENPKYDIRTVLKKQLNAKTNADLDSLTSASKKFRLDPEIINSDTIHMVNLKDISNIRKGTDRKTPEMCKNGIICIQKPIFDKDFRKAVFEYSHAFTCVRILPSPTYDLVNGKWVQNNK